MARRLVRNGHKVHMISLKHSHSNIGKTPFSIERGIFVWWLPIKYSNKMSYIQRLFSFIRYCYFAYVKGRKLDYDLVFATSTPLTISIPGILLSKLKRTPFILEIRDLWPELPIAIGALKSPLSIFLAKLLEKWSYDCASHIIGLSEEMCDKIEMNGQSKFKISNIPNGCDIDLFNINIDMANKFRNKTSWLNSNPLVIYTGALGKINNVSYLVETAECMKKLNSDVRFLIVGKGKEEKLINEYALKLKVLDKNLFFIRELPKDQLIYIYAAATVCTSLFMPIPEMEANSANKFFDALASGKPLMINYGGWQAKLIEEYNAGIVVPPNDVSIASKQLQSFIVDEERLVDAGKAAKELANKYFDRDKLYKSFENVLLKVSN